MSRVNFILFRNSTGDDGDCGLLDKSLHTHTHTRGFFFTFHTGGSGSGGAGDLPGETGTLDGLRALLNLVLITAAMDGHHLTRALLHLVRDWGGAEPKERRGAERKKERRDYFQLINFHQGLIVF